MKFKFLRFFFALSAMTFFCAAESAAQFLASRDASGGVYAITNARIVTVSGADIERGTIVVRDGLIAAVGANVAAPADARVIDGSGLTVYPGFFDGYTNLGLGQRQQTQQQTPGAPPAAVALTLQAQQQQQQSNSAYAAGLQPDVTAADLIRASDAAFESARNQGFTTALVVPRERLFVGQSALINLAGETTAQAIVRAPVALHIQFQPIIGGQYPTALMGTYTAVRQLLLDAQRLQLAQAAYEKSPRGQRRPEANRSLEALFPVLRREVPVVFQADSEREIGRALDMAREFNLNAMIAGGFEAHRLADRLKTQNVPVLLSLNFPKRTATASPEADPESLEVLRYRVEAQKAATKLAQARVRFAMQSGGLTNLADFWTNAGKAVENGLGKGDALRAMTLTAADIFGVADRLGSIETGKIANLTVTRGDLFDKNRTFTHVFVDGRMFEIRQQPAARPGAPGGATTTPPSGTPGATTPPAAGTPAASVFAGTWNVNIEVPGQPTTGTIVFQQQGDSLTGTVQTPFGTSPIENGAITGNSFRFTIKVTIGETIDVVFNGTVTGNQISGTATTPQGTAPFSGSRNP
jgi:imidazolonepropionase-like amidohydrolase